MLPVRPLRSLAAGASLALFAAPALAQAPAAAPPPLPRVEGVGSQPSIAEPPYDATQHGGLAYGAWVRATRGTERRSSGMMATGISLIGLGAVLMVVGTVVYADADHCTTSTFGVGGVPVTTTVTCGPAPGHTSGMALLAAGLVTAGIGIPLAVLGATEVPRAEAGGRAAPSTRLALSLGARGAALTLRF